MPREKAEMKNYYYVACRLLIALDWSEIERLHCDGDDRLEGREARVYCAAREIAERSTFPYHGLLTSFSRGRLVADFRAACRGGDKLESREASVASIDDHREHSSYRRRQCPASPLEYRGLASTRARQPIRPLEWYCAAIRRVSNTARASKQRVYIAPKLWLPEHESDTLSGASAIY